MASHALWRPVPTQTRPSGKSGMGDGKRRPYANKLGDEARVGATLAVAHPATPSRSPRHPGGSSRPPARRHQRSPPRSAPSQAVPRASSRSPPSKSRRTVRAIGAPRRGVGGGGGSGARCRRRLDSSRCSRAAANPGPVRTAVVVPGRPSGYAQLGGGVLRTGRSPAAPGKCVSSPARSAPRMGPRQRRTKPPGCMIRECPPGNRRPSPRLRA